MLLVTSKSGVGKGSHYHVVFYDEAAGTYKCAEAGPKKNPHTHDIVLDEFGELNILPALDGHSHEGLEDYTPKFKSSKESDDTIIRDVMYLYKQAVGAEEDSFKKAEESDGFYKGTGQWSEKLRKQLKDEKRACLTINKVEKGIDTLIGTYIQQRTDITYLPQEEGDQFTADVYNIVAKHILTKCDFDRQEKKAFKDQLVTGRGNFHVYVDFDDSLEGEIKVKRFNWRDVKYGPHEEEDISDCEYTFKEKMYSLAKVKQLWPKKADDISLDYTYYEDGSYKTDTRYPGRQYTMSENAYSPVPITVGSNVMVDIANKEYRVIECARKIYTNKTYLVNESGYIHDAEGWKDADINATKALGFYSIPRTLTKYRITRIAGNVLLSDEDPAEVPFDGFDLVPVYAKKSGNDYWGKVESAKDPQREVNKRHSQAVDIVNKASNYNYFHDATTFPNKKEKNKFLKNANIPGATFEVTDSNNIPVASQGQKVPSEVIALLELGTSSVEEQMNVVTEFAGANEPTGRWIQRQKQKGAGNEFLFDNLSLAKRTIGRMLVPLIQKYWSADRIYRLLQTESQQEAIEIGEVPLEDYPKERIIEALENVDAADLDVVVAESEASPSSRFQIFALLTDLLASGQVQIPPSTLIEVMPELPESQKQKLLESIYAQQDAEAAAAQETHDTEIDKSLIGKSIMPPKVQAKLDADQAEIQEAQYIKEAEGAYPEEEQFN